MYGVLGYSPIDNIEIIYRDILTVFVDFSEMTNPQLYPLEINAKTKEPFLRLRKHKNIILTPPRCEDASILNDPPVHEWLPGPQAYPCTLGKLFSTFDGD